MYKPLKYPLYLLLIFIFINKAQANIYAIDLTKVNYPAQLQGDIDFLTGNINLYNHWSHEWTSPIPKKTVLENLTSLYKELDKISPKNIETDLLLGDVAHYLYNMEVEDYYQKAIDNYQAAQKLDPSDYRVYWFLGNHYSLSEQAVLSIATFKIAMEHLPMKGASAAFWSEYAVACTNAGMISTAKYAAHKASIVAGERSYIDEQMSRMTLKRAPLDTTIMANDMWSNYGKQGKNILITNFLIGTKLAIDSTWGLGVGDYKNKTTYLTLEPGRLVGKDGKKIGLSILLMAKIPDSSATLNDFLGAFTANYKNKQAVTFTVGDIKNCVAYEIKDPTLYPEAGGGHMYAIAIERDKPEYPGMALEIPAEVPKDGKNQVEYFRSAHKYNRLNSKIYYLILLDSCEDIHEGSLALFTDFLQNNLLIE